jgi:protein SHQ1
LTKVTPGEEFADLDMMNRLLARTGEIVTDTGVKGPPRIQVLNDEPTDEPGGETGGEGDTWRNGAFDEALMYDFQISQTVAAMEETVIGGKYGFNNQYSGHFLHIQNPDVLTISDPEEKSAMERWVEMRSQEDIKFDKEWFLADQLEPPDELGEILNFKLPSTLGDALTSEEQTQLRNLRNRECIPLIGLLI